MELLILGLIVFTIYIIIRALSNVGAWVTGSRYRAYRLLAQRYHGRYESRGLSDAPTVSFHHRGNLVRVGLAPTIPGQPANPRTRVVVRFRKGIPFRLELAPISRPTPAQPPKGTRHVSLGDLEFDRGNVVVANDPEMARGFLSPQVRWAIANLQRLVQPGGMLVSVNPERLLVQIDRNLGNNPEALLHAVGDALVLHDGLHASVTSRMSEGISILDLDEAGGQPEEAGPPICKVCGECIAEGPVVFCGTCKTPHHRECWEYVGACSIYGCGGKTTVKAPSAG